MAKGMNYIFKVRANDGRVVARPHIRKREENYITFSYPQRDIEDSTSHVTIIRPEFKKLEGAALKYLDNIDSKYYEENYESKQSQTGLKIKSLFKNRK